MAISRESLKRIRSELPDAKSLESCGIYLHHDEDDVTKFHGIIFGPDDTPYEGGVFLFGIKMPSDYPFNPPSVKILTTGGGTVRFNPNLYACGKVCLSILGTWSGPPWTPAMNISTVLLSIQSLMGENPMLNEPGFENHTVSSDIKSYNNRIIYDTLRVAAIDNIKNILNGTSMIPHEFHQHIFQYFISKYEYYKATCKKKQQLNNTRAVDIFHSPSTTTYQFDTLLQQIEKYYIIASNELKVFELLISTRSEANNGIGSADMQSSGFGSTINTSSNSSADMKLHETGIDLDISMDVESHDAVTNEKVKDLETVFMIKDEFKCGICFDLIATAACLNCGHICCYKCINQWLVRDETCPICRIKVTRTQLHRIIPYDSMLEVEAKRLDGPTSNVGVGGEDESDAFNYVNWCARRDEGIAIANGKAVEMKKPKRHQLGAGFGFGGGGGGGGFGFGGGGFGNGIDDEDDDDDMHDDMDDEDFSYPSSHPPPFPSHFMSHKAHFGGHGHKLGASQEPSLISNMAVTAPPVEDVRQARLKRLEMMNNKESSESSLPLPPTASPQKNIVHAHVSSSGVSCVSEKTQAELEKERQMHKILLEKKIQQQERERLRLEIQNDKEARKMNKGVLPGHHVSLYSKESIVNVAQPSRQSHVDISTSSSSTVGSLDQATSSSSQSAAAIKKDVGVENNHFVVASYENNAGEQSQQINMILDSLTAQLCHLACDEGSGSSSGNGKLVLRGVANTTKKQHICQMLKCVMNIIQKIVDNISNQDNLNKYSKINTKSKLFTDKINAVEEGMQVLLALGFQNMSSNNLNTNADNASDPDYLVLPIAYFNLLSDTCTKIYLFLEQHQ